MRVSSARQTEEIEKMLLSILALTGIVSIRRSLKLLSSVWAVMPSLDETLSETLSDSCVHGLNECGETQILDQSGCSPQGLSQKVIAQSVQTERQHPLKLWNCLWTSGRLDNDNYFGRDSDKRHLVWCYHQLWMFTPGGKIWNFIAFVQIPKRAPELALSTFWLGLMAFDIWNRFGRNVVPKRNQSIFP